MASSQKGKKKVKTSVSGDKNEDNEETREEVAVEKEDEEEPIDVEKYMEECEGDFETIERGNAIWDSIVNAHRILEEEPQSKEKIKPPVLENPELKYLEEEVFPVLLPALEDALRAAEENDVIKYHKPQRFNSLDYLAELLWNRNPKHPERMENYTKLFDMEVFKECLVNHPREPYPLSWIYTEDEAARIIQRNVRGWLVRKDTDVTEMRQFWKTLKLEEEEKEWVGLECSDPGAVNMRRVVYNEEELKEFLVEAMNSCLKREQ